MAAGAIGFGVERGGGESDDLLGGGGIFGEVGDDHLDGDGLVVGVPAIVIGDHGECGVAEFGFAGAASFAVVGHADDVPAHGAMEMGLGAGGEGRAFHVDVGAAVVDGGAGASGGVDEDVAEPVADRVGEGDVGDDAVAEEGEVGTAFGAVDELVDGDDVGGLVLFFEGADGADADDVGGAEFFHAVDVGAVVQFAGEDGVGAAVTGEEDEVAIGEASREEVVGGFAKRGGQTDPALLVEAVHLVETAAADDADFHDGDGAMRESPMRCMITRIDYPGTKGKTIQIRRRHDGRDGGGWTRAEWRERTLRCRESDAFPSTAASRWWQTAGSLVDSPVDADTGQGTLGGGADLDLTRAGHASAAPLVAEQVDGFPCRLQVGAGGHGIDGGAIGDAAIDGPLVDGGVHLAAVIHDAAALGLLAGLDEAGDGERGQEADNCDDNHNFDQGEGLAVATEDAAAHMLRISLFSRYLWFDAAINFDMGFG